MIECWAASLGDCGIKQSREHIVSESLWNQLVDVQGLSWCKDAPKRVGISSLTEKTLCDDHNSGLSPADGEGKRLFVAIGEAAKLADKRNRQVPHRRRKPKRFEIQGALIERWFLKTTINIVIAQKNTQVRWALTDTGAREVPPILVETAFGRSMFTPPMGLYSVLVSSGERIAVQETMSFAPLLRNDVSIIGGLFTFRGFRFLVYFAAQAPPQTLTLPGIAERRMSEWDSGNLDYRPRRLQWMVGRNVSHYIDYVWPIT